MKLEANAFGSAAAIISAACMLLLGVLANLGVYTTAAEAMMNWHMFFSLSIGGIIAGVLEAAVISYVFAYAFVKTYNALL